MNKQTKQKEAVESSQIYCSDVNCNSKKQQVLLIDYNKTFTKLTLLCLDCGLLSALELNQTPNIPKLKPMKGTKDLSYLG